MNIKITEAPVKRLLGALSVTPGGELWRKEPPGTQSRIAPRRVHSARKASSADSVIVRDRSASYTNPDGTQRHSASAASGCGQGHRDAQCGRHSAARHFRITAFGSCDNPHEVLGASSLQACVHQRLPYRNGQDAPWAATQCGSSLPRWLCTHDCARVASRAGTGVAERLTTEHFWVRPCAHQGSSTPRRRERFAHAAPRPQHSTCLSALGDARLWENQTSVQLGWRPGPLASLWVSTCPRLGLHLPSWGRGLVPDPGEVPDLQTPVDTWHASPHGFAAWPCLPAGAPGCPAQRRPQGRQKPREGPGGAPRGSREQPGGGARGAARAALGAGALKAVTRVPLGGAGPEHSGRSCTGGPRQRARGAEDKPMTSSWPPRRRLESHWTQEQGCRARVQISQDEVKIGPASSEASDEIPLGRPFPSSWPLCCRSAALLRARGSQPASAWTPWSARHRVQYPAQEDTHSCCPRPRKSPRSRAWETLLSSKDMETARLERRMLLCFHISEECARASAPACWLQAWPLSLLSLACEM
ncbi:uncharacterized protein LOC101719205 [Heterocephalus glaber]|uniref:Uncharacterized protein LOC101719205 n=1 Tax=Heterocephalus glaber TaxID=10181 RepID=A0AAX6RRB2_HETGA|nr:uncharacterized protein LOC101719205 [Heterocephalus glaber]